MLLQNLRSSPPQRDNVHIKRTVSAIGPAHNLSKAFLVERHLANVPFQSHPGANLYGYGPTIGWPGEFFGLRKIRRGPAKLQPMS